MVTLTTSITNIFSPSLFNYIHSLLLKQKVHYFYIVTLSRSLYLSLSISLYVFHFPLPDRVCLFLSLPLSHSLFFFVSTRLSYIISFSIILPLTVYLFSPLCVSLGSLSVCLYLCVSYLFFATLCLSVSPSFSHFSQSSVCSLSLSSLFFYIRILLFLFQTFTLISHLCLSHNSLYSSITFYFLPL